MPRITPSVLLRLTPRRRSLLTPRTQEYLLLGKEPLAIAAAAQYARLHNYIRILLCTPESTYDPRGFCC